MSHKVDRENDSILIFTDDFDGREKIVFYYVTNCMDVKINFSVIIFVFQMLKKCCIPRLLEVCFLPYLVGHPRSYC